ncbi:hypothetical protein ASPSYDRAFT_52788, partial [Aspergillus sydowii CBS 593.65]
IPNLRHLCVPAGHFIEFLDNLLKRQNYLPELQSFETYYGSRIYKPLQCWGSILGLRQLSSLKIRRCARWEWLSVWEYDTLLTPTPPELRSIPPEFGGIPPELQGKGDILLRRITIGESNLGYTILARLIQSCKRLEAFSYHSTSGWDAEDSEPTTIIQALLLHKDSLTYLGFDFLLCIESSDEPQEPDLFYNLGMASQLSLKLLTELYVFPSDDHGWPDGLFDGFDSRVFINLHDD